MTVAFEDVMQRSYMETQKVFFLEESNSIIQVGSDKYLDLVILFNKHFTELNKLVSKLNDEVEDSLSSDTDEMLTSKLPGLKSVMDAAIKTVESFKNSHFYPGVKTELEAYAIEVSCLSEFVQDIIRKTITFKEDKDFLSLFNELDSL